MTRNTKEHRMRRAGIVVTTTLVSIGLMTAAAAGVAGAGEQLSKKEYLKQGNAVCKVAGDEIDAVAEEAFGADAGEDPSPEEIATFVDGFVPVFREALDELDALEGPPKLDKKVGKFIDDYTELADEAEDDPEAFFDQEEDPFAKIDQGMRKLGLTACGE